MAITVVVLLLAGCGGNNVADEGVEAVGPWRADQQAVEQSEPLGADDLEEASMQADDAGDSQQNNTVVQPDAEEPSAAEDEPPGA